jgi:hypothetical protein
MTPRNSPFSLNSGIPGPEIPRRPFKGPGNGGEIRGGDEFAGATPSRKAPTSLGPRRELVAAINACCLHRGDSDANRAALIAECSALSPSQQMDLARHFEAEARIWAKATGANTNFSTCRSAGNK